MPVYFKGQVAHYLRQLCQSTGCLFLDLEFPATMSSLTHETGKVADLDIIWLRPPELSENPCLFSNSGPENVRQGRLGNCWFVAACACLILHETVFRKIVVVPQFSAWSNYCGLFEFRFWRFGEWVHVVVDDLLPTLNGELLYCHSCNPDEFWCALLEKAYAKYFRCDVRRVPYPKFLLLGSYEALEGGELADALIDFTGGFTECLEVSCFPAGSCLVAATLEVPSLISSNNVQYFGKIRSNRGTTPLGKNAVVCDLLYKLLSAHHLQNTLIAAAISTGNARDQEKETALGLVIGHAYAVTRFCTVPIVQSSELVSERRVLLVRLTNPWGHGTWKGSFAVGSEASKFYFIIRAGLPFLNFNLVEDWNSIDLTFRRLLLEGDDLNSGHIWMRFEDFLEQFNYIVVCHTPIGHNQWFLFTPGHLTENSVNSQGPVSSTFEYEQPCLPFYRPREFWTTVSFHGIWSLNTSGGCLNCTHTFFNNPQFRFDVLHRTPSQIALYLIQKTVRDPDRSKSTTGLYHIGMSVFRVEANRTSSISSLHEHVQLIANSCYRNSRTVWMRLHDLSYGRYVVVPTTFYADCFTGFMLRFVGPPPIIAFPLERAKSWPSNSRTSPRRAQSMLSFHKTSHKLKLVGRRFSTWFTSANKTQIFDRTVLITRCPFVNGLFLRITLVQAIVWPPTTAYLALLSGRRTDLETENTHDCDLAKPGFYACVTVNAKSHFSGTHRVRTTNGISRGVLIRFDESFLFHRQSHVDGEVFVGIQLFVQNPVYDELHSQCNLSLAINSGSSLIKRIPLFHVNNSSSLGAWKRNAIRTTRIHELMSSQKASGDLSRSCDRTVSPHPIRKTPESLQTRSYRSAFYHSERLLAESETDCLQRIWVPETNVSRPRGSPSLFGSGDTDSCGTITLLLEG
ncbi:hypothetical protein EG68_04155 [Paragonimus skrjabini miyazakii]|uniref:Calpain catalytic domain-containing protein n=1 Tax=Paragonimus skrjabini miyazakii TaxID=59628 RepID=A0A8S9Z6E2_9TREM|nr:hypothetical protein EG68_04155 [Paragonimus skrjabini miyazakii]